MLKGMAYGCGQCLPCRLNRRRVWTHRILLEAAQHHENSFTTLTYSDEHIPDDASLHPRHLTLFIKRLRYDTPYKFRYFACGEYGDTTERPHYHLALFGYPTCQKGLTRPNRDGDCCLICDHMRNTWASGLIYSGQLEPSSAAYIAGYVTKKLTDKSDVRLKGRHPEFARMSLRPAIGLGMMDELASTLMQHRLDQRMIDVPTSLQHGNKKMPLGRYLRRKLRERIGRPQNAPTEIIQSLKEELHPLRQAAYDSAPKGTKEDAFRTSVITQNEGKIIQIEAREQRQRKKQIL